MKSCSRILHLRSFSDSNSFMTVDPEAKSAKQIFLVWQKWKCFCVEDVLVLSSASSQGKNYNPLGYDRLLHNNSKVLFDSKPVIIFDLMKVAEEEEEEDDSDAPLDDFGDLNAESSEEDDDDEDDESEDDDEDVSLGLHECLFQYLNERNKEKLMCQQSIFIILTNRVLQLSHPSLLKK